MCDSSRMGCVWRTTSMWLEQPEIRWARRGIFTVAWCDSGKLCTLAAQPFQSQQSGALTRMWMWCQVQPSQKERATGGVHCKNEGMLFRLLGCRCIESGFSHAQYMKMTRDEHVLHMDLNLATFQYIDGFGCKAGCPRHASCAFFGRMRLISWRHVLFWCV